MMYNSGAEAIPLLSPHKKLMTRPTTTLTFTEDQLYTLMSSMEAEFTDHMTEEELKAHDKLYARLAKAVERVG